MHGSDDDRLLQATLDEDEKRATRAYLNRPVGYQFNRRFRAVTRRKSWPLAAHHLRERFRRPSQYTAFFFLVLECACTPESLLKLQWDELDLASGTVFLQLGSSETFLPVPVSEFLCKVLSELPRVSDRLFAFDRRHVLRAWRRISSRARLDFLTLEELQAEGAWRRLEAVRAASFTVRPSDKVEDTAPGHAAVDDMTTLQADFEELSLVSLPTPVIASQTAQYIQLSDSDDHIQNS